MGFSSALQGKSAHDALLSRQDAELRLLEVMKRCLLQKVKCDKEYAIALTAAAQHGLKIDRADDLQGKSWKILPKRLNNNSNSMQQRFVKYKNAESWRAMKWATERRWWKMSIWYNFISNGLVFKPKKMQYAYMLLPAQ